MKKELEFADADEDARQDREEPTQAGRGSSAEAPTTAPGRPRDLARQYGLPAVLFFLTVLSTIQANGKAFSASVLAILVAHEMGHYLAARHHGLPRSLPHFIPLPVLSPIGTLGAVISLRTDRASRNQIMDVGAAGPIAGFIFAVPLMIIGIKLSHPVPVEAGDGMLMLGESLLSTVLEKVFSPELPPGTTLLAHPIMIAAWAGFLITSINLLPMGQLDGGHVLYALSPRRAARIAAGVHRTLIFVGLIGLGVHGPGIVRQIAESFGYAGVVPSALVERLRPFYGFVTPGFLIIAGLGKLTGLRHPPVRRPEEPLTPLRVATAGLCLVIWILTFMPNPAWSS